MNIYENVISYKYELCKANLHIETNNDIKNLNQNQKTHYFILDNPGEYALAHWIFESFIFIKLLKELNNSLDNIKILTTNDKKYVKSILNFFNMNKNEIVYKIDNYNNTCYFHKAYALNTAPSNLKKDKFYNENLEYYINYIKNNIIEIKKTNKILFLPRNDKDNYVGNDRKINNTEEIKNIVIEKGGIVLDTYSLNNIDYQFSIINNSDIIILDYGSSYFFNCIFLNSKIKIIKRTVMYPN